MMLGEKVVSGTVFYATDPEIYCAMANAGYDFIWTEMQHSQKAWQAVARMWAACPHAKAVPGVRIAYTDEREIQHALDAGAQVLLVPTVGSVEEAREIVQWAYHPPMGRRSRGGGQAYLPTVWGDVPGGFHETSNDNLVVIAMIETFDDLQDADAIAAVNGIDAVFAASGDSGNFSGYKAGGTDYERVINIVHDAAIKAGKRLCDLSSWKDRPDFICLQAESEITAITRGAKEELGDLAHTQPAPRVGPHAAKD